MADHNYWKNPKDQSSYGTIDWKNADAKVELVIKLIKEQTGKTAVKVGFGADTTKFIDGSAAAHGYKRGGADLSIVGTNIFVEVTGPNVDYVSPSAVLWVRPDKLDSACKDSAHDTWIVHVLPTKGSPVIRVIHCDAKLCDRYAKGEFPIEHPLLKGKKETYVAISANDITAVQNLAVLFAAISTKSK